MEKGVNNSKQIKTAKEGLAVNSGKLPVKNGIFTFRIFFISFSFRCSLFSVRRSLFTSLSPLFPA